MKHIIGWTVFIVIGLVGLDIMSMLHSLPEVVSPLQHISYPRIDNSTKIFAGEIHYSRIPVQYWQHRIQMVKALGMNTLSVYVMWNHHEVSAGKFDFSTQNKNLTMFLELANKYNMKVLLRPGPFICAEWDLGGIPARLLAIPGIVLRANNAPYLQEVKVYFQNIAPVIRPYLAINNGPIVLLQIQNEYGNWGNDKNYLAALRQMWSYCNITCDLYHADGASFLTNGHWPGANIGVNGGITESDYTYARSVERDAYIFGGEIYSGWFTHFNDANWAEKPLNQFLSEFNFLLTHNHSFSMYMVHGGTNFGTSAGANGNYLPYVTSYDYSAPISEQGSMNDKFIPFREMVRKYVDWVIPEPPASIPMIVIPSFKPVPVANLFGNLPEAAIKQSPKAYVFESAQLQMWNQGMAIYQTTLETKTYFMTGYFHDFTLIYLDNVLIYTFNRTKSEKNDFKVQCQLPNCKLQILIQAMGHVNVGGLQVDPKGLTSLTDTYKTQYIWNISKFELDSVKGWTKSSSERRFPALSRAIVTLKTTGDTYLNMKSYQKGYVWVNGRNLGRYWNIGPQQKLFCPGVWLKEGDNQILVLDMLTDAVYDITGERTLKNMNQGLQIDQEQSMI